MKHYYSNGKLLLTGEYVVLEGALALAIPTRYGQSLIVEPIDEPQLKWKSFDNQNQVWLDAEYQLTSQDIVQSNVTTDNTSKRLLDILQKAKQLNPEFLNSTHGFKVTTQLDFPKYWGLGSSSTLINNIANWADIDPYKLLDLTFGGSGYDIACAQVNSPLTYQLNNKSRTIHSVDFNPKFKDNLYFVYLNQKQNSREAIAHYKAGEYNQEEVISIVNQLTKDIIQSETLVDFELAISKHEATISKVISQKTVKELLFKDFNGSIKSLGAWGGDFVLVTSETNPTTYFIQKGYNTVIRYTDMIKN